MKLISRWHIYALISVVLLLTSCSDDDNNGDTPPPPQVEDLSGNIKVTNNSTFGSILTDGNGASLYFFANDALESSNCTGGCLGSWPIYYSANLEIDASLEVSDFATITHPNGEMQTTYKGWPLYYFAPSGDGTLENVGEVNGDGVGSVWYVAKPDYAVMMVNAQLVGLDGNNYTSSYEVGDGVTMYIVDDRGNTLYSFVNDSKNVNNFTAEDFSNDAVWPIFNANGQAYPSSLNADDFSTIDVHGRTQITFKGWPLYYFGQDAVRGENKGISVPAPGIWPIVNNNTEIAQEPQSTATIWDGPTITFTKADEADPTVEANQDRITDNVWITRGNNGGQIFNIKSENTSDKSASPADTEWALGTTADISSLDFKPFRAAVDKPQDVVGKDLVLHLITDDVYINVKFTSWTSSRGGGFSYERSTKP